MHSEIHEMICSVLKDCFSNFQIMLDQLEEELQLMDEVNRKENFTFMDNITMEDQVKIYLL